VSVGGKKAPPTAVVGKPPAFSTAGIAATAKPATTPDAATPTPAKQDNFESGGKMRPGSEFVESAPHASGIEQHVALLEQGQAQLLSEHAALRGRMTAVMRSLVAAGFSPAVLVENEAALQDLRAASADIRRRWRALRRRKKSLDLKGHSLDADALLEPMPDRLVDADSDADKALLALQLLEQGYAQAHAQQDAPPTWRSAQGFEASPSAQAAWAIALMAGDNEPDLTPVTRKRRGG
jgi:hypothetical protein